MMAITMMLTGASCGSADTRESYNGDNAMKAADAPAEKSEGTAAMEKSDGAAAAAEAAEDYEAPATADAITADGEKKSLAKSDAAMADEASPDGMAEGFGAGEMTLDGVAGITAEGETGAAPTAAAAADGTDGAERDETKTDEPEPEPKDLPEAGQLTAGEWNDNDNWGFFTNLVNAGTISFPAFGLDPTDRTAVTVKDNDGKPVVNAKVVLKNGSKDVWQAVTDKSGNAYLFGEGNSVTVTSEGKSQDYELKSKEKDEQGNSTGGTAAELTFDGGSKLFSNAEVMFIVDTTGSMGDELLFLQSDFSAITREVGTDGIKYAVTFYRDEEDDYVTKHTGFTDDVKSVQSTLNKETADGGGDYPEAVAQVLKETITEGEWSEDSVKIAFLIFDAPPHEGNEDELLKAAKAAGEKGIRIVPIVSSGSDRETELFARSLAVMSGGTYVFLTDDSGIGGSHLEPIIGDYEVEKLYDIIVRVIGQYKQ